MDNSIVAKKIKALRESKRLTRNALANLAGVSPTYIYQLEQGLKSPTVEYLGYICQALEISLSDFFKDSEEPELSDLTDIQKKLLFAFINSLK